jgi:hypothetical protein
MTSIPLDDPSQTTFTDSISGNERQTMCTNTFDSEAGEQRLVHKAPFELSMHPALIRNGIGFSDRQLS